MSDPIVRLLNALQRKPLTNQEKADNCLKLADILDNVEEDEFDMSHWVDETECGITACALGHAVLSGMIPGIEVVHTEDHLWEAWDPQIEGSNEFLLWETVGEVFFGIYACNDIFYETEPRDACYVADELRDEAARLLKENDDE